MTTRAMLPSGTFNGSVAVVTGGGSGLGEAIAKQLGTLGAAVAVIGRNAAPLDRVAHEIRAAGGVATAHAGDVRSVEDVERCISEVVAKHGEISLLVNNAAGNFRVRPEDLSPGGWRAVTDIVLNGSWNWTQGVGRRLIKRGEPGSVVSIGTVGALNGGPDTVHSATAKAGVLAMTKSLASAWGSYGIRLNIVTPGPISNTGGSRILVGSPEREAQVIRSVPLGRFGAPSDIADATAYLLSPFAGYITGTNLLVDGGSALAKSWEENTEGEVE